MQRDDFRGGRTASTNARVSGRVAYWIQPRQRSVSTLVRPNWNKSVIAEILSSQGVMEDRLESGAIIYTDLYADLQRGTPVWFIDRTHFFGDAITLVAPPEIRWTRWCSTGTENSLGKRTFYDSSADYDEAPDDPIFGGDYVGE